MGAIGGSIIVEVEAGYGPPRGRPPGLFDDRYQPAIGRELDHPVGFRVPYLIAEYGGAWTRARRALQHCGKAVAVKQVVAQYQRDAVSGNEAAPNDQRLSQPFGSGLLRIPDRDAPLTAVVQQAYEARRFRRGGDDKDVADSRQH